MATDSVWRLDGGVARLAYRNVACEVDARRPDRGAQRVTLGGALVAPSLWAINPLENREPLALASAHVRGPDLVVGYAASESFPFRTEVYWRCVPLRDDGPPSLSLILSVETDRLDTHPVVTVESEFLATRAAEQAPNSALLRTPDSGVTLLEVIHPSDLSEEHGGELRESSDGCASRWKLFDHFLEKGVIRRARLSLVLADRPPGAGEAHSWRTALFSQPAPLTA